MKKGTTLLAGAAGAGIAGLAYALLPKKKVPSSAIVDPFDKEKYLGKWNEVARLPSLIEKDLRDRTEEYSLNDDCTRRNAELAAGPFFIEC